MYVVLFALDSKHENNRNNAERMVTTKKVTISLNSRDLMRVIVGLMDRGMMIKGSQMLKFKAKKGQS